MQHPSDYQEMKVAEIPSPPSLREDRSLSGNFNCVGRENRVSDLLGFSEQDGVVIIVACCVFD
jgi:hypothetical protein